MTKALVPLLAIVMTTAPSFNAGAGPATRPPATVAATTKPTPVLTLAESDHLYARRTREASEQYNHAVQTALQERVQQLRALLDRAIAARHLDDANQIQAEITSAEAELQAKRRHTPLTLHITGTIDGRCVLIVGPHRAVWQQLQYSPPTDLTINGVRWDPSRSTTLENEGRTTYLPVKADLRSASLVKKAGRNLVEVVAGAEEVRVAFDDTEMGAGKYDLTIELNAAGVVAAPTTTDAKE
jgi:biopolymer transport protein ExbD